MIRSDYKAFYHIRLVQLSVLVIVLMAFLFVALPLNTFFSNVSYVALCLSFHVFVLLVVHRKIKSEFLSILLIIPLLSIMIFGFGSVTNYNVHQTNLIQDELEYKLVYLFVRNYIPLNLLLLSTILKSKFARLDFNDWLRFSYNKNVYRILLILNIIFSVYLVVNILGNIPLVGYFSRVIIGALLWYIFFVGYFIQKSRFLTLFTIALLLVSGFFEIFAGSRNAAIFPIIIFVFGYFLQAPHATKRRLIIFSFLALPLFQVTMGIIGLIRADIGRGDISSVDENRISVFADAFSNALDSYFLDVLYRKEISEEAISRLSGGGAVQRVIALTPNRIDYRGVDNLSAEILNSFKITGLQSSSINDIREAREGRFDLGFGLGAARIYGFNPTGSHSVEWSIFADAYSRGGLIFVILYGFIVLLLLFFVWRLVIFLKDDFSKKIFTIMLIKVFFGGVSAIPMVDFARSLILNSLFTFVFLKSVELFLVKRLFILRLYR